jgi:hypothetical protein
VCWKWMPAALAISTNCGISDFAKQGTAQPASKYFSNSRRENVGKARARDFGERKTLLAGEGITFTRVPTFYKDA